MRDKNMSADEQPVEAELARTWAGITLLEEIRLAEMRILVSMPLAAGVTRKSLAAELGMSVSRLASFLDGANLGRREFGEIAKWCEGKTTPHVSPYLVAIGVLGHWIPARFVKTARGLLWAYVRRIAEPYKVEFPEFAVNELDALYPPEGHRVRRMRSPEAG
jgi:hypothetical protein